MTLRLFATLMVLLAVRPAYAARLLVSVPASTAKGATIYVAGPAEGGWRPDAFKMTRLDDGTFAFDLPATRSAAAPYKITRGSWQTVEKASDGSELPNRTLPAGPSADVHVVVERWADDGAAPTSRPSSVVGDLRIVSIDAGDAQRTLRIWLPPGYDTGDARYPVLYMHDGQNCFDAATSAFGSEWRIDETLTELIDAKTIRPIIVVGIDNAGERRIDEYTPHVDKGRGGKGEAYERFVVETVKPFVDRAYRTNPDREHTLVGGSSLGGLISLDMTRRFPNVFGGALAMSPSLWWSDEALTGDFERDAAPGHQTRIVMTMGALEGDDPAARARYVEQARRLERRLAKGRVAFSLTIDPSGVHNEASWARQFPDTVRRLLAP